MTKRVDMSEEQIELTVAGIAKHRANLGEDLVNGADDCPNCGFGVVGMLKTQGYFDNARGVEVAPVYEIGCVVCPPYYIESETGVAAKLDGKNANVKRRSYSARASTPEEAVNNWNIGKYVEDTRFGLNVHPDEAKRLELVIEE